MRLVEIFLPNGPSWVTIRPNWQATNTLFRFSIIISSLQLVLIKIVECIYRREKLLGFFTFRWCRSSKKRPNSGHSQSNSMQLNHSTNSNSQVEEEKTLTRTLVRDRRTNDYAVIVSNLYKQYDDSDVVRGIDFAVKQGMTFSYL